MLDTIDTFNWVVQRGVPTHELLTDWTCPHRMCETITRSEKIGAV